MSSKMDVPESVVLNDGNLMPVIALGTSRVSYKLPLIENELKCKLFPFSFTRVKINTVIQYTI